MPSGVRHFPHAVAEAEFGVAHTGHSMAVKLRLVFIINLPWPKANGLWMQKSWIRVFIGKNFLQVQKWRVTHHLEVAMHLDSNTPGNRFSQEHLRLHQVVHSIKKDTTTLLMADRYKDMRIED